MKRIPVLATLTSLMLSATFAASLIATHLSPMAPVVSLDSIPMTLGAWAGFPSPQLPDRNVELLAATSILGRGYHKPGRQLDLFIAYYALQRPGASWHTPRNCLPSAGWEISKYDSA